MATFNTKQLLHGSPALIPAIAQRIETDFRSEGYEVATDPLSSGGYEISITRGGLFKAVLGMKTALKVTLMPQDGDIHFEAGVGIWGQQAIPTVISMLFFWPVLITQIWGMIEQSKLDDKALDIAREVIASHQAPDETAARTSSRYCTSCGTANVSTARFCCGCGKAL